MIVLSDASTIRNLLETDRPWSAYPLGDLAPGLFEQGSWYCPSAGDQALVLLFRGFTPPVLFTLGSPEVLGRLLSEIPFEPSVYVHIRPEILPILTARYSVPNPVKIWRMALDPRAFAAPASSGVVRLSLADLAAVEALYADGESTGEKPHFFRPSMLQDAIFYGVWENKELIAAAGTHLVVPAEGVAAIGNVYTRRDRRGRGLAARTASAVVNDLVGMRIQTIVLNVAQQNLPAIRIYERLGFKRHCAYYEGLAVSL